jgi:hypothetical protein
MRQRGEEMVDARNLQIAHDIIHNRSVSDLR